MVCDTHQVDVSANPWSSVKPPSLEIVTVLSHCMKQDTVYYNHLAEQQTGNNYFVELYFTITFRAITNRLSALLLFLTY
jgi:hypothetical protein